MPTTCAWTRIPRVGNNARICDLLGLRGREPFGDHGAITLGFMAEPEQPLTIDQLVERVREQIAPPAAGVP